VRVRSLAAVTNQVHATDDLTNGEEANDFSGGDTGKGKLLGASIANTGKDGRGRREVLEGGGVGDEGLEVGLESGQVAVNDVRLGAKSVECGINLRRSHVLATEHQFAELNADLGIVDGRRDQG
jgi:hypothetical protein